MKYHIIGIGRKSGEYEGKKYNCKGSGSTIDCSDAAMELYQACGN